MSLTACSKSSLPEYWLCKGESSQTLLSGQQMVLEGYHGKKPLLLERFNGVVAQYMSSAFTGLYQECSNNEQQLTFRVGSCDMSVGVGVPARGLLDKLTGKLVLSETQNHARGSLVNEGYYQCEYLGNSYPPSIFYKSE
ncbi:hypothetical protein [Polynucleobacter sp. UB-Tiil-W10]|uniref:hypothetical protein n=1 Tax=Polynucleobacter sp. UB-Tiil-W10 TaxID=1855648 RepID=UPI001C0D8343|nr:hypothetical protein [Polynucleobacter sp. UB-Tiil-W10]MBU3541644.1 hypothetical protein [Polynucleobacter sp. UB-Tiil-W10]